MEEKKKFGRPYLTSNSAVNSEAGDCSALTVLHNISAPVWGYLARDSGVEKERVVPLSSP